MNVDKSPERPEARRTQAMSVSESSVARSLEDTTYRIIGAAMKVHTALGPGLKEAIYQRALSSAMEEAGLSFEEERPFEVTFDGGQVGLLYFDHLVEGSVIVEEKSFSHLLTDEEVAQVITYLAVIGARVGLLLNFGRRKLQYKRILPPKNITEWQAKAVRYAWRPKATLDANPLIRSLSADSSERPS